MAYLITIGLMLLVYAAAIFGMEHLKNTQRGNRLFALLVAHWWSVGWSMLLHGACLSRINLPIAALNEY